MRAATAAAVVVLVMLGLAGTVVAATTPIGVVRQVMAAAPGKMPDSVRCVPRSELLRLVAARRIDRRTVGITILTGGTSVVLLDWRKVCFPLHRYATGHQVQEPWDVVNALAVVMHEKAHVQGIRTEWKAECWGIRAALKQLRRRWGYSAEHLATVRYQLALAFDRARPEDYKLYGRCRV